jgi:hypothetical protein
LSVNAFILGLSSLVLALLAPRLASAQSDTLADSLFRDAREAMKAGDYQTACPKFRESNRLEPSAGALLNLAICERKLGHVATAWTKFRELADLWPGDSERQAVARRHMKELEPELPRLYIQSAAVANATLRLDGVALEQPSLEVDLFVDPGAHLVELVTAERVLARQTVTIGVGERFVVALTPEPEPETPPAGQSDTADSVKAAPAARNVGSERAAAQAWTKETPPPNPRKRFLPAAYVASGVSLGGFALAITGGTLAFVDKNVVSEHCPNRTCDAVGVEATEDGRRHVAVANAGLLVGAVGLAVAGAFFWYASY